MHAQPLSPEDESFLDEVFDLSVRCRASGEALDLDALLAGREHLRQAASSMLELAQDVAVGEVPRLPHKRLPVVPGFSVLEEIGRGGMGIVYRARQERLGRIVALKILAPSLLASARARERFLVEARALGRVRHPHVVAVHDVFAQDELCAYAMEWVDGVTLARAIATRDPRLDVASVARLGVAIAAALGAVHAAGLVHRDVKPSNVLLRQDGSPLLSDFGLVLDAEHSLHTATGEFLGTAAYAAPEQLRGEHARVRAWTDVYGLGVTLYVALAGEPPPAASTAEMLRRIEGGLWARLDKGNARVPRDLATIVAKAMDREPEHRYATAAELAEDLQRFLRFQPIRARPAGLALRLQRWMERSPQLAAALAALLLTLAVGLVVSLYLAVRVTRQRDDLAQAAARERDLRLAAEQAETRVRDQLEVEETVSRFWRDVFRSADASLTGQADMTVRAALDKVSQQLIGGGGSVKPEVEYAIRITAAETYLAIGIVETAEQHLVAAHELRRRCFGDDSEQAATVAHLLGRAYRFLGRFAAAERWQREAVRVRRITLGPDNLYVAQSLTSLGILLRHLERFPAAEAAYAEALAIYRHGLGEADENVAIVLGAITSLQARQGRWAEAEPNARRALEILTGFHGGRPHLDVAHALFNSGHVGCAIGRPEEGERRMREALAMTRSLVGTSHRQSAGQAVRLATHLRQSGKAEEALLLARESLAACATIQLDPEQERDLAALLLDLGLVQDAEALLARELERTRDARPRRGLLLQLGAARTRLARFAQAELDLQQAWASLDAVASADDRRATAAALAELYEAWTDAEPEHSANAAQWRGVRDSLEGASGR